MPEASRVLEDPVGKPAPDFVFREGEEERAVRLSSLWKQKPTVVVFLRHFG